MVETEDENLVYRSPSEMSNYLNLPELQYNDYTPKSDDPENVMLPISNSFDILSPEEGSITRYANIFDDLDNYESDDNLTNIYRDSYSDTYVYNSNRNPYDDKYLNDMDHSVYNTSDDLLSDKTMTFSDRVVKERQKMIREKLLSRLNSNRKNVSHRNSKHKPRPHLVETSFSFTKEILDVDLHKEIVENHKRINKLLEAQKDDISNIKLSSNKSEESNQKLLQLQQENDRLLSENQQNCETIRNLKMDIENVQSDLIIERKQNEQLLRDKVELQNKISLLSKENKSLLTSQEMMQNMHNNEIEDFNIKKVELSSKIAELQNDLDFFRDSLQESHKMNEMLKAEMTSLAEVYKNDKVYLQKLKIENKRLMENNSAYKSQNYSLIEINDRLRKRTLFCNHSGDLSTTNSSTVTNVSSATNYQSTPSVASPNGSNSSYLSNTVQNMIGNDVGYLDGLPHNSDPDGTALERSLASCNVSNVLQHLNSTENSPNGYSSNVVSPNSNTIVSNSSSMVSNGCKLDFPFDNIEDVSNDPNNVNTDLNDPKINNLGNITNNSNSNHLYNILSSNINSYYYSGPSSVTEDFNSVDDYNIHKMIKDDKIANPTTKWVADRVSRNSSLEALESLREKIRNITIESNVEHVNINSSLKCFQSNVTINLIQNKLQLISQRLNETIV